MTTKDRLRRLGIGLFVLACLGVIALGVLRAREVDSNGDVVVDQDDPDAVEISGDADLIDDQPPDVANQGPSEAEIVELTIPADGAEILQQSQVGIDLGDLYDVKTLRIDGTTIPEEELTRRFELNQAFFQPGEGAALEVLPPGRVCAQADVVRLTERNEVIRTVEWCFSVT